MYGKTGSKHHNWKGGKPRCLDCGKRVGHYENKRCRECWEKFFCREGHWNWKNDLTHNKKHKRKLNAEWEEKNKERRRFFTRQWRKKNPLKTKAMFYKRKISLRDLELHTIQLVYEDNIKCYGTLTCYLCEKPLLFGGDCLEHKTPLSRGGTNKYENLAVACRSCNSKKHNKTLEEYEEVCKN